jgi:hypothetical protein
MSGMSKSVHLWSGRIERGEIIAGEGRVDLPDGTKMELWPIDLLDLNQAERQLLDSCTDVEIDDEQAIKVEALLERFRRQERDKPSKAEWAKKSAPPASFVAARRY